MYLINLTSRSGLSCHMLPFQEGRPHDVSDLSSALCPLFFLQAHWFSIQSILLCLIGFCICCENCNICYHIQLVKLMRHKHVIIIIVYLLKTQLKLTVVM